MNPVRSIVGLVLALFSLAASADSAEIFRAHGSGTLGIDTQGRVTEVNFDKSFGDAVDAPLINKIKAWRFEPIVEDGRAVAAIAHFNLALQAELANSASDALKIVDVAFVDPPGQSKPLFKNIQAPKYPRRQLQNGFGAEVIVRVETDAQGKVLNVAAEGGWLTGPPTLESRQTKAFEDFVSASIKAVSVWDFTGVASAEHRSFSLPIRFAIERDSPWSRAHFVERAPEPWMLIADGVEVTALLEGGQARNAQIKLLSDLNQEALSTN